MKNATAWVPGYQEPKKGMILPSGHFKLADGKLIPMDEIQIIKEHTDPVKK